MAEKSVGIFIKLAHIIVISGPKEKAIDQTQIQLIPVKGDDSSSMLASCS